MNKNILSPYIRLATHSTMSAPFVINTRILYDYEIIYVKDGSCKIKIDGTEYICKKNNIVFLRPGVPHSFHDNDTDFIQPHIHFDAVYSKNSTITPISFKSREAMNELELSLIQEDVFADVKIPYVFVPDNPQAFQKIFFDIIYLYSNKPNEKIKLKSKMLELLDMIIEKFVENSLNISKISDTVINNIKNYIDENYRNTLTLDTLSSMYYMNKFTLMRKFKKMYGINIIKYYNNKRIEAAKNMLTHTNLNIKAIGEILNFTDAYSFSRFFKTHIGISPNQFRNTH